MVRVMSRFTINEALCHLGQTYRALDIRCVAIASNDRWRNHCLVVRFTYEDEVAVRKYQVAVERAHGGPIDTAHFRILTGTLPISEWAEFSAKLGDGSIATRTFEVPLSEPITWATLPSVDLRAGTSMVLPHDGVVWPSLEYGIGRRDESEVYQQDVMREVGGLGYQNLHECISIVCGLNTWPNTSCSHDVWICLPAFVRVARVRATAADVLEVLTHRHAQLSTVTTRVVLMQGSSYVRRGTAALLKEQIEGDGDPMRTVWAAYSCGEAERHDAVQVIISDSNLGELDRRGFLFNDLIPVTERNALLAAFQLFCPAAKFRDRLLRPHEFKARGMRQSDVLERHVSWLLALAGAPNIVLGEYEHLYAPQTGVERGTVDILAYRPATNTIFAIGCTLLPPKEEDLSKALSIRSVLMEEVFKDSRVAVQAVIFSGAASCAECRGSISGDAYVAVIDATTAEMLLKLLEDGHEEQFFELLMNPAPSQPAPLVAPFDGSDMC